MKTALAFIAVVVAAATAAAPPEMEKHSLFGAPAPKGWSVAESTLEVTSARVKVNSTALHWHVTVDHYGGERNHPVGWPRFGRAIPEGAERDWSAWDYLRLWVYTTSSRPSLPHTPAGLNLYLPDRANSFSHTLTELKLNEWVEIRIPISKIPRPHDVRYVQFHISESNYQHGDTLDLFIDDLALLRYARPTLLEFAPETRVAFADTPLLATQFHLGGLKPNETVPVVCELRRDGKTVARTTTHAARGPQRLSLRLTGRNLLPGHYELAVRAGDGDEASARVRFVESPWR